MGCWTRSTNGASVPRGGERGGERPLRILVVNWQDRENPHAGGAEAHLHQIFGRLASGGDSVTLLCSGFRGAERRTRLDGIEIHRTGSRHTFPLFARRYFRRHLLDVGYEVIVEDLNKVPVFTTRWSDVPVLLLVHHLFGRTAFQEASFPIAAATWLLEKPIPRAYHGVPVVAVSASTADDLIQRGFAPGQLDVVPNGVDLDFYNPDPAVPRFEHPTALYMGRLKRYKRVDLILLAFARLLDQLPEATLLVVGRGDHGDELQELALRLGLGGRAHFLGYVSEEDKRELFQRSWVHLLTSPKEGWGISTLEAAACGTPTVASDAPGLKDSVIHGRTGLLVPHGDVPALADALRALLGDLAAALAMGRQARTFAEDFSWEDSARRMRARLYACLAP